MDYHTEVTVTIPSRKVEDFYLLIGLWLNGKISTSDTSPPRRQRRAPKRTQPSRYDGIRGYLRQQEGQDSVKAPFSQIAAVVGELPTSAEKHRAWWANTERNSQARAWMEEGWRVDQVDFTWQQVTFVRAAA